MVETMKNKDTKITYFFQNGRKQRITNSKSYAKEMFYGFQYFKSSGYQMDIIEFESQKTIFGKYFFLLIEKKLRNYLKLPLYWSYITNKNNFKKLTNSDYLIFANNRMGCSAIPMIIAAKILNRQRPKSLCFVMGLFSRVPKYRLLKLFQTLYLNLTIQTIDKFVFLSEGEYFFALDKYPKNEKKFYYLPFAIDQSMWNQSNESKVDEIIFVGNDGNRDFQLAEAISRNLPNIKFTFVSEEINKDRISPTSKIFVGSWGNPKISDLELKKLYQQAKLTIIPLKESLQPSGQSVALQSISCGTPVLITKTNGFWDNKNFKDKVNIFFAIENDLPYWIKLIEEILNMSEEQMKSIVSNGLNTVKKHYDLIEFSKKIEKILKE